MKNSKRRAKPKRFAAATDLHKKNGPVAVRRSTRLPLLKSPTWTSRCGRPTPTCFYTRYGNPTHTVAEKAIAELEGAEPLCCLLPACRPSPRSILALVKSGDHIVAQRDIYGGATKFLTQWLPKFGVEATLVDTTDYEQHARAIRPNTKLLYLESPTNPTLRVVDLKRVAALAKQHNVDHAHRQHVFNTHQLPPGRTWHRSHHAFRHEVLRADTRI